MVRLDLNKICQYGFIYREKGKVKDFKMQKFFFKLYILFIL